VCFDGVSSVSSCIFVDKLSCYTGKDRAPGAERWVHTCLRVGGGSGQTDGAESNAIIQHNGNPPFHLGLLQARSICLHRKSWFYPTFTTRPTHSLPHEYPSSSQYFGVFLGPAGSAHTRLPLV